jgi:hypothetical protein
MCLSTYGIDIEILPTAESNQPGSPVEPLSSERNANRNADQPIQLTKMKIQLAAGWCYSARNLQL